MKETQMSHSASSDFDLATISWPDVEQKIASGTLAVLAVGACEQHGAHLPLTVDTDLSHGVAGRIAKEIGALLLPAIPYGDAWTNEDYPGTISISPTTLLAVLSDIGKGLLKANVKGLVIINGHFGNHEPIVLAARHLVQLGLPTMYLDYPKLEETASFCCKSKPAAPSFYHADEVETSMMMVFKPDSVNLARATPEYPEFPVTFGAEPMQFREFNQTGVFGDPTVSSAETGEAIISRIVADSVTIIDAWKKRKFK